MPENSQQSPDSVIHLSSHNTDTTASVDPVGATLRSLVVGGTAVLHHWPSGSARPFFSGATLFPWPNRIRDGRWSDGSVWHELDVSEPSRHTALHGLVADSLFQITDHADDSVTLECTVSDAPGYPFTVALAVRYTVNDQGVECQYLASNRGTETAPVAIGAHPFVTVGDVPMRSLTIQSPVTAEIDSDDRLLPVGLTDISQSPRNISTTQPLASLELDTAFQLDPHSPHITTLTAPDGSRVELWQSPELPWLQAFTTDEYPGDQGLCSAIALEPMSAPPDAFNSHTDLHWIEPGTSFSASWTLTLHPPTNATGGIQ